MRRRRNKTLHSCWPWDQALKQDLCQSQNTQPKPSITTKHMYWAIPPSLQPASRVCSQPPVSHDRLQMSRQRLRSSRGHASADE